MNKLNVTLISCLLILTAFANCNAQTPQESPEIFVLRYLSATKDDASLPTVKFLHPEALSRFKSIMSPLFDVKTADVGTLIFGIKTRVQYDALTPEDVYVKFLDYFYRTNPGLREIITDSELNVLGSVSEGELVHVLYRMKIKSGPVTGEQVEIVTIKKNGSGWGAMLSADYEGLIENIIRKPEPKPSTPKRKRS